MSIFYIIMTLDDLVKKLKLHNVPEDVILEMSSYVRALEDSKAWAATQARKITAAAEGYSQRLSMFEEIIQRAPYSVFVKRVDVSGFPKYEYINFLKH